MTYCCLCEGGGGGDDGGGGGGGDRGRGGCKTNEKRNISRMLLLHALARSLRDRVFFSLITVNLSDF